MGFCHGEVVASHMRRAGYLLGPKCVLCQIRCTLRSVRLRESGEMPELTRSGMADWHWLGDELTTGRV